MRMASVRTAELTGEALDWAVGVAVFNDTIIYLCGGAVFHMEDGAWSPSTDWADGGPLIDKHGLLFDEGHSGGFCAWGAGMEDAYGPTHLIAACRAIVSAKLGETVEIPQELIAR